MNPDGVSIMDQSRDGVSIIDQARDCVSFTGVLGIIPRHHYRLNSLPTIVVC